MGLTSDFVSVFFNFSVGVPVLGIEGKPTGDYTGGIRYKPWVDINLDSRKVHDWGKQRGLDLKGDLGEGKPDHWVHFTHAPNWDLYRRILRGDSGYAIDELQQSLPQTGG